MKPRIIVVGGTQPDSRAIERVGFGYWSHMGAVLDDGTIIDARFDTVAGVKPGVQKRPAGYLDSEERWAIFESPSSERYDQWVAVLEGQLDKPYDTRGILDFGESVFTGTYVDENYAGVDSKAWFCDCLQFWAAFYVGELPTPPKWIYPFAETPSSALKYFIGAAWVQTASKGV